MVENLVSVYGEFFETGDIDKLKTSLAKLGKSTEWLDDFKPVNPAYVESVRMLAAYLANEDFRCSLPNGADVKSTIRASKLNKNLLKLMVDEEGIDEAVDYVISNGIIPDLAFNTGKCAITNIAFLTMEEPEDFRAFIKDVLTCYCYGFTTKYYESVTELVSIMAGSVGSMQFTLFCNIDTEFVRNVVKSIAEFGLTVQDYCVMFNGAWYCIRQQINDGFISIPNPSNGTSIACASVLYLGDYFLISVDKFKQVYESNLLAKIRFKEKVVKVRNQDNSITERPLRVPVYLDSDTDKELLLSDYMANGFIYNAFSLKNVG